MRSKGTLTGGIVLILIGIALLVEAFLPGAWALVPIGLGLAFLVAAGIHRVGGLAIPGALLSGVGTLLLWQSSTGWWASWLYLWPVVLGALGVGFVVANLLGMGGRKVRALGWIWIVETGAAVVGLIALRILVPPLFSWALIVVGLGAMLLLSAVLAGVAGLAIPGTILSVLGGMLYGQNATGLWESWSYLWPLVPGSVGLGLVLANALGMGGRAVRRTGWSLIGWHLVVAAVFGLFNAADGRLIRFWPLTLVLAGLMVLSYALRKPDKSLGKA
jgi:hypothetical protein